MTLNPGLVLGPDQPETFTDVREIQASLVAAGIELNESVPDDNPEGPAHLTLIDPDGSAILIDQHRQTLCAARARTSSGFRVLERR